LARNVEDLQKYKTTTERKVRQLEEQLAEASTKVFIRFSLIGFDTQLI
jgi:hypothetical protein